MIWKIEFDSKVEKDLSKISKSAKKEIIHYLEQKIATPQNPRRFGKPLRASLKGLWRYRVGDYRIICEIENHKMVVLVIKVGHRKKVYD